MTPEVIDISPSISILCQNILAEKLWKVHFVIQDTRYKIQDKKLYLNSVW